jgi:hypothetical protein
VLHGGVHVGEAQLKMLLSAVHIRCGRGGETPLFTHRLDGFGTQHKVISDSHGAVISLI